MELKSRKEMDPRYMWDFSHMFKTREDWENAFAECEKLADGLGKFQNTLGESAEALKRALDYSMALQEKAERVYIYAMLHKNADNSDPEYQRMDARVSAMAVKVGAASAFLTPEIVAIPEEKLAGFMKTPGLATYRHMIDDACRARAHTLDLAGETMLAKLGDASRSPEGTYTMLASVDMTYPKIKDENGGGAQLTHGNFAVYRESGDRRVRRDAFEGFLGEYAKYKNTFAALYSGEIKFNCYRASVRGYSSACEAALFDNNVPVSVLDSLIEAMHERLSTMKQYLALRKELLGLDELHMYDLYCPLVKDVDFKVPFEEAKNIVKAALLPLGEDYQKLLDRAYGEHWIDVYENRGKYAGAFSCGVHGVHPYVLLNYTDTLDDVFTLAHELGHAMHSFKSSETQDFANHDYRILVAEVASTVNEVLLCKYLLKTETDPARRAYVLNHFLEGFRTTVFRQTLFAEFERGAHAMYEADEPVTEQSLTALYTKLNELYYEGAVIDEAQKTEWTFIPHFYMNFYVYQYATGFCSAVAIASRILETGSADDYLRFLTTGGSDYPLEELKIAGVDLTRPDSVLSSLDVFQKTLDEFSALMKGAN